MLNENFNPLPFTLLNASQVAARLHISRSYVYRLASTGELRTIRLTGATLRFLPEDAQDLADRLAARSERPKRRARVRPHRRFRVRGHRRS